MHIIFPYDGQEHLGIGYLAARARLCGHTVTLYEVKFGDYITGYKNPEFGKINKEAESIISRKPDIVAFSLVSPSAGPLIKLAKVIRKSGFKTIAGGPHFTAEPEITINSGAFDAGVRGEADEVFCQAIDAVQKEEKEINWLDYPGKPATELPPVPVIQETIYPAKDLFYKSHPYQSEDYLIATSRGCPYNCIFCSSARGRNHAKFRRRSVDDVIGELEWAIKSFKLSTVYFIDDLFTINKKWLNEFLSSYKEKINLPFHAITHPSHLDKKITALLANSGCFALRIGVQSLTPSIRKWMGRHEKTSEIKNSIQLCRKFGIKLEVDHMVNIPGETLEDARKAVAFYNIYRPCAIKVYWLTALPGSMWFEESVRTGLIKEDTAIQLKAGKGYGKHSYLFATSEKDKQWLGIHLLLSMIPFLPENVIDFLLKIRAERWLLIHSFFLLVGGSRLLSILHGWDKVGIDHLKRLKNSFIGNRS